LYSPTESASLRSSPAPEHPPIKSHTKHPPVISPTVTESAILVVYSFICNVNSLLAAQTGAFAATPAMVGISTTIELAPPVRLK